MVEQPNAGVDRIESAANITVTVSTTFEGEVQDSLEIPISRLDTSKEVEINQVRESSLKPTAYSVTSISYSGTMTFMGSKVTKENSDVSLEELFYNSEGVPMPLQINIYHDLPQDNEIYQDVLVESESYEVRSEETTETAFDWVAMDKQSDQPD